MSELPNRLRIARHFKDLPDGFFGSAYVDQMGYGHAPLYISAESLRELVKQWGEEERNIETMRASESNETAGVILRTRGIQLRGCIRELEYLLGDRIPINASER